MSWHATIWKLLIHPIQASKQVCGHSFNRLIHVTAGNKRDAEFVCLSGKGDSRGWRFNRQEIHSRRSSE